VKVVSKGVKRLLKCEGQNKQKDIAEKRKGGKKKLEKPLKTKANSDTCHKEAQG